MLHRPIRHAGLKLRSFGPKYKISPQRQVYLIVTLKTNGCDLKKGLKIGELYASQTGVTYVINSDVRDSSLKDLYNVNRSVEVGRKNG